MATTGSVAALMSVPVERAEAFRPGVPVKLFEGPYYFTNATGSTGFGRTYDVSPDGQRFLMVKDDLESDERPRIIIVQNWTEELKRLVPTN
jgi:hypothetical protein